MQSFYRAQAPGARATLDGYGENLFSGAVAAPYLKTNGLSPEDLATGAWVKDKAKADKMADAVREWATDRGASVFCHWFHPLASTYRHGQAGQVQLSMFEFGKDGKPIWDFKGKDLLQGETDGSSYPNGGLRATHTAGAYLTVDPESPIWLKGDSIFVPACFVSFEGKALDEKTPLKRAAQAMSKSGTRLFKAMGVEIDSMIANIGLEQEFFLFLATSTTVGQTCRWLAAPSWGSCPLVARSSVATIWRQSTSRPQSTLSCRMFSTSASNSASP